MTPEKKTHRKAAAPKKPATAAPSQTEPAPLPTETPSAAPAETIEPVETATPAASAAPAAPLAETPAEDPAASAPDGRPPLPESPIMAEALEHGRRVAAIAETLFQDLAELHQLGDVWGHRLRLAAELHDIGLAEARKGHHKISMRLIEEDLSLNIPDEDRPWVALLARYHRKAQPSRRHARFAGLRKRDQGALRKTAALLRIADALDYTRTGVVKNLAVSVKKNKVIIAIQGRGDCTAEMGRALEKGKLFMRVFKRNLECVCLSD